MLSLSIQANKQGRQNFLYYLHLHCGTKSSEGVVINEITLLVLARRVILTCSIKPLYHHVDL